MFARKGPHKHGMHGRGCGLLPGIGLPSGRMHGFGHRHEGPKPRRQHHVPLQGRGCGII